MDQGLIPRRYAKALFKAACERGCEKRLYELTGTLVDNFISQPGLNDMVANPFIASADKIKVLGTASGATDRDTLFADFLKLLTHNRRLDMIRDIAVAYRTLYRRENDIARVTVTSAAPLDPAGEARLKKLIDSHLKGGSMEYTAKIDPTLIGGFTIAIDNELLDASVAGEFKQLQQTLISR